MIVSKHFALSHIFCIHAYWNFCPASFVLEKPKAHSHEPHTFLVCASTQEIGYIIASSCGNQKHQALLLQGCWKWGGDSRRFAWRCAFEATRWLWSVNSERDHIGQRVYQVSWYVWNIYPTGKIQREKRVFNVVRRTTCRVLLAAKANGKRLDQIARTRLSFRCKTLGSTSSGEDVNSQ